VPFKLKLKLMVLLAGLALLLMLPGQARTQTRAAWRFAPEIDYGPFVYQDHQGRVRGLSIDLLDEMRRHAELPLQMLPPRPLAQQLAAVRRGEVDLLSSLRPTPERAEYLAFSRPYVRVPAVLVGRTALAGLQALEGRSVAVGRGYAVEAHVRQHHPGVRWQPVDSDLDGLRRLLRGEVDALVVDVASVHFIAREHGLSGFVVGEPIGFEYALSFAWRRDRPDIGEALEEALRRIPADRRQALLARWSVQTHAPAQAGRRLWTERLGTALLLMALGLAGWTGWRRHVRRGGAA
jgi:ABC-type amino acid transport substrate-binding protein